MGIVAGACALVMVPGRAQIEVDVEGEPTTQSLVSSEETTETTDAGRPYMTTPGNTSATADSPDAIAAIDSANQLVAPRAEIVTEDESSTPPATAGSGPASSGQSLTMEGLALVDRSVGGTEAKAIASGAELMRMLNLVPKRVKIGEREIDDRGAVNLFPDENEVRKLMGENPSVVYRVVVNATPLPDPMIIPWIRTGRVVEELFDEAVDNLNLGEVDKAREQFIALMTEYPTTEQARSSQDILEKLIGLKAEVPTPQPAGAKFTPKPSPTPIGIQLNPNVKISTALIDPTNPNDSRVVIGGRGYGVGERIRGFTDHKIKSISDDIVIIEVEKQGVTKEFTISVRPTESN